MNANDYSVIHSEPASLSGISASLRIWSALLYAEIGTQFGKTGLGFLAKVAEPCFHMGVLVSWHYAIRVMPVYGTSTVLFIGSGIMPMFLFIHLSSQFDTVTRSRKQTFRQVNNLDIMIVKGFVLVSTYLIVGFLVFLGIYLFQTTRAAPFDPKMCVLSLTALCSMGVGLAIINSVISEILPIWHYLWTAISRSLILFGGVLYVPDLLPQNLRQIVQWNPVAQAVDLFRQGIYPNFPTVIFKPGYLFGCCLFFLMLGLVMERSTRDIIHKYKILPF